LPLRSPDCTAPRANPLVERVHLHQLLFEPAAALIYLIFIALFLLTRALQRRRGLSPDERLSNAIDLIGEAARRDFDVNEKRRALELLQGADPSNPLYEPVGRLIARSRPFPPRPSRG
jgi:hypothetical protein